MAWTATIESKQVQNGAFYVGVQYTNGTLKFGEAVDMTGGTIDVLNGKIQAKLDMLNATQLLASQVGIGAYVPSVAGITPLQDFQNKLQIFRSAQNAVNLGLILNTDPIFINAQTNLKAAFDPSFIGQF